ncbi:hypothetical protein PAPYR_5237 [Paratrimastix pyriformis]|uniref:EGF-like domain-containing protein n=1 Tax=Paratrimastix pyriformis TaxID=342808 RepID=A0ABQ8UI90_9EUKA|nr:hypothetical protein PAPYR_5237 [Paratrimastix pyriformis]
MFGQCIITICQMAWFVWIFLTTFSTFSLFAAPIIVLIFVFLLTVPVVSAQRTQSNSVPINGLLGRHYNNAVFGSCNNDNYLLTQFDFGMDDYSSLDVSGLATAMGQTIRSHNLGYFKPPVDGQYTFRIYNKHRGQLDMDGYSCGGLQPNDPGMCWQTYHSYSFTKFMERKTSYWIRLREQSGCAGGNYKVYVTIPGESETILPADLVTTTLLTDGDLVDTTRSSFAAPATLEAGNPLVFDVMLRDDAGNALPPGDTITYNNGRWAATATHQAAGAVISLVIDGSGTSADAHRATSGSTNLTLAGTYVISIKYDGYVIPSSSFEVVVTPTGISAAQCVPAMPTGTWPVGAAVTWSIQPRDTYGNNVDCSPALVARFAGGLVMGSDRVAATVACSGSLVQATANPTRAGSYGADVTLDGTVIDSVSSGVTITPGALEASTTTATWPAGTVPAGSSVVVIIQGFDASGNRVSCAPQAASMFVLSMEGPATASTSGAACSGQDLIIAAAPQQAGAYTTKITYADAPIRDSGSTTFSLVAGPLAASRTTATWPTAATTAGNPVVVLIQGFDIYGNAVTCPAGSQAGLLSMTMTSPADTLSASGAACSSGQFSLAGTPRRAGSYRTDVALAGVPIKDSGTASFDVQAASFDASRCVVTWPPANVSRAGVPVVVAIAGRDPFDNAVGCEASWAGSFMGAMTPSGDGADTLAATAGCSEDAALLVATFEPTIAQTYNIAVEVASVALPTSPHTGFQVVPAGPAAARSTFAADPQATAGAAFEVTVQGRDAYGNPIACTDPAAGGTFGLQWDGADTATTVSWSCAENASRFVAACSAPTMAGNHTLAVVLVLGDDDDDEVPLGSSNVTVAPGALAADMTTAVWPTGNFTAGDPVPVTIRGADAYGNPVGCTPETAAQVGVGLTSIDMAGVGYATGAACNGPDFVASARPLLAGSYVTNATYAGAAIGNSSSSTSSFVVVAADLDGASSTVMWPAANVSTAGVPVVVTVAGRDPFGNAVRCDAHWAGSLTGRMTSSADGAAATVTAGTTSCSEDAVLLVATFEPTIAQTYAIALELAGAALPIRTGFRVDPVGPDAAQSIFAVSSSSSSSPPPTAGLGLQVTVTARDPYGNPVGCTAPTAGSTFGLLWDQADAATSVDGGVLWACAPASSSLAAAPAFVATFTPTVTGNHTVAPTLDGTRVGNSSAAPVVVSVRPGALAAATTTVIWPTSNFTAGSPVNTTIRGADSYGNPVACAPVTAALLEVTMAMETMAPGGTTFNTTCTLGCDGADFVATARPWLAGAYNTWVTLAASGEPIANSGATSFRVVAGSAWFATSSVAWFSWADSGGMLTLGAPAALALAARDPYGNPVACAEATAADPFAVLDDDDGLPLWGGLLAWSCGSTPGGQQAAPASTPLLFVGSFTVPPSARVGPHNLTVLCAGAAVSTGATGLTITIVGPIAPTRSSYELSGGATVGSRLSATVTARDTTGIVVPCTSATSNASFALLLDGTRPTPTEVEWGCTAGSPALFVATCHNCTAAPGTHQVTVVAVAQGGVPLSGGGQTNITTDPAPVVCPEQSTFTGPPDGTCVAGSACTLAIAARDCTGAAVPCTDPTTAEAAAFGLQLDGAAVAVVSWSCSMDSPPLFVAAFNWTAAGPHTVAVTLGREGTLLGSSGPTTVIVTPGRAPTATGTPTPVALSGDGHLPAGGAASVSLAPHDSYGNPIGCTEAEAAAVGTTGGSNFTVLIDGTPLPPGGGLTWSCSPDEPARFVGTFTAAAGGGFSSGTHTLAVLCDGAPLGGEEAMSFTVTGPLTPSQSSLSVSSTALPSGSVLVATVTARDASGAVIPCTDATRNATFGLLLDGGAPPDAVWACSDGRPALFLGSFTVSGPPNTNHTVAVVARGGPGGGGADVPLGNGSVTASTTVALVLAGRSTFAAPAIVSAGTPCTVLVTARDAAGDVVPCTGPTAAGTFRLLWDGEAAAVPGGRPTWACDPTAPALFTASFIPTQAGTHALAVTYAGQPVLFHSGGSAAAQITVTAARAAASQCEFSAPTTCNQPPSLTFTARDSYGNPVACTEATARTTFVLRVDGAPASNATTAWACADDGRFVATASAHWALGAHVLTATLDGEALSGRSVCVQLPGSPAASTSSFFTQPSGRVTAGQPVRMHITARDPASNPVGCSAALTAAAFVLLWDGAPMEPQPNLTCAASAIGLAGVFIPTAAGPHAISVGIRAIPSGAAAGGLSLLAGNVSLAVVAAACANASRLVVVAPAVVRPGQNLTVVLEARDAWGVPIPCPYADPAPPFLLLWNGSAPAGLEWGCSTNGTASLYAARFAVGTAANTTIIEVRGSDGGVAVGGGPTSFSVTIDANGPTLADLRLTSSNPFGPSWARPGDTLTGTFTPSEPLRAATVLIAGRSLPASPAAPSSSSGPNQRWAAGRVVDQADCAAGGDGAALGFAVSQATDLAGNGLAGPVVATGGAGGVLLDCTAPRLTRVAFVSSNANPRVAQPGDWLRVAFTASEPLPLSRLRISIAAHEVANITISGGDSGSSSSNTIADVMAVGTAFEASYQLAAADPVGPVGFTVSELADRAGNPLAAPVSNVTAEGQEEGGTSLIYFGSNCTRDEDCGTGGTCAQDGTSGPPGLVFGCHCPAGRSGAQCQSIDCYLIWGMHAPHETVKIWFVSVWVVDPGRIAPPEPETRYCTGDSDCQAGGDTSARCATTPNTTSEVVWECHCTSPDFTTNRGADEAHNVAAPGRTCVRVTPSAATGSWAGYLGGSLGGLLAVGLAGLALALVAIRRKRQQDEKRVRPEASATALVCLNPLNAGVPLPTAETKALERPDSVAVKSPCGDAPNTATPSCDPLSNSAVSWPLSQPASPVLLQANVLPLDAAAAPQLMVLDLGLATTSSPQPASPLLLLATAGTPAPATDKPTMMAWGPSATPDPPRGGDAVDVMAMLSPPAVDPSPSSPTSPSPRLVIPREAGLPLSALVPPLARPQQQESPSMPIPGGASTMLMHDLILGPVQPGGPQAPGPDAGRPPALGPGTIIRPQARPARPRPQPYRPGHPANQ